MKPEHEEFLIDHMKKMGFIFIIDCLKEKFPNLTHEQACKIYDEFKAKHAESKNVKHANKQLKQLGEEVANSIERVITPTHKKKRKEK